MLHVCRLSKADDCYSLIKTKVGTPGYTAPEVLAGNSPYGHKADVWSAGVLLYLMLLGSTLLQGAAAAAPLRQWRLQACASKQVCLRFRQSPALLSLCAT